MTSSACTCIGDLWHDGHEWVWLVIVHDPACVAHAAVPSGGA